MLEKFHMKDIKFLKKSIVLKDSVLIESHIDILSEVPTEIFFKIIYYLTPFDLLVFRLTCKKYRSFIGQYAYKSQLFRFLKMFKKCLIPLDFSFRAKPIIIFETSRIILKRKTKHAVKRTVFCVFKDESDSVKFKMILPCDITKSYDLTYFIPREASTIYKRWTGCRLLQREIKLIFQFLQFMLELHCKSFHEFVKLFE